MRDSAAHVGARLIGALALPLLVWGLATMFYHGHGDETRAHSGLCMYHQLSYSEGAIERVNGQLQECHDQRWVPDRHRARQPLAQKQ